MHQVSDLERRLDRVRSKERAVVLLVGLSRTALVLIASLLGYLFLDWFFELPYWARLIATLGLLGYAAHSANRFLRLPLRRLVDDDELALRVEEYNPGLQDRLISTLQLHRAKEAGAFHASPDLLAALEEETFKMASPLDFLSIINREVLFKVGAAAAVALLLQILVMAQFPDYFAALALRLVNPDHSYPTRTRIKEIRTPAFVARGDEIVVTVLLEPQYEIPTESGVLVFRSLKDGSEIPVELAQEDGATFKGRLAKSLDDVAVLASLGDCRKRAENTVRVLPRPEIRQGTVEYLYPAYTNPLQDAEVRSKPQAFGGLTALQGTKAEIQITVSKPLVKARISRFDGKVLNFQQADGEGLLWRLPKSEPFLIEKSSSFHLDLTDRDGLTNSLPPVEYPVEARPDNPPAVKLLKPLQDSTITPEARPLLRFSAQDDFGVRLVWIVFRLKRSNQPDSQAKIFKEEVKAAKRNLLDTGELDRELVLDSHKLEIGDELTLWLEVDDHCKANDIAPDEAARNGAAAKNDKERKTEYESPYPHSREVHFKVISKEAKLVELQEVLEQELRKIKEHEELQKQIKTELIKEFERKTQLEKGGAEKKKEPAPAPKRK